MVVNDECERMKKEVAYCKVLLRHFPAGIEKTTIPYFRGKILSCNLSSVILSTVTMDVQALKMRPQ
jgi:hypothetical protein